jgi:Cellulase (glycosyl hydrolase family 5)
VKSIIREVWTPRAAINLYRMKAWLPVFVAVTACAVIVSTSEPAAAGAAGGVEFGLTDDAWLLNGPGTVDSRLDKLQSIGVKVVRFTLNWSQIATSKPTAATDPADPAYDWSTADSVLDGLRERNIDTVLQLAATPKWANGGKPPNYIPTSASTFRDFATAAATRYRWVTRWLVWNEPNQLRWLRPASPRLYTQRLLNPAYAAIHAVIARARVAGGGTAPRGSTGGLSPVAFLLGLHAAHARLDAYAHNPYPLDPKRESPLRGGCTNCSTITMATIGKLVRLVAVNFPRARIWLSEYGYQSNPPDRILGVSLANQARYIGEGNYIAYRTPRVDLLIHFLYQDEPNAARFQSGLVTLAGRAKPALAAFRLPLAETHRTGSTTSLWGQIAAPEAGTTVRIERLQGGAWRTVGVAHADGRGFFTFKGTLPRGSRVRAEADAVVGATVTIT